MIFQDPHMLLFGVAFALVICSWGCEAQLFPNGFNFNPHFSNKRCPRDAKETERDVFLDQLVKNLTVPELGTYRTLFSSYTGRYFANAPDL